VRPLKNSVSPEIWDALKGLGQESALAISGTVRETVARRVVLKLTSCTPKFSMKFTISHHAKEHGTEFLMDIATYGCGPGDSTILKVRHTVVKAVRDFWTTMASHSATRDFTPAACEGTSTLFEVDYFEARRLISANPDSSTRSHAAAFWQGLLFRPDFSRGKIEDASSPDRVLDGRAEMASRSSMT